MTLLANNVVEIAPGELRASLSRGLILDVRSPEEYAATRIDGSWLLPHGDQRNSVRFEPRDGMIVFVCQTGQRATQCANTWPNHEGIHIAVLSGGLAAWVAAGYPVVGQDSERDMRLSSLSMLERAARAVLGGIVVLCTMLGLIYHPGYLNVTLLLGASMMASSLFNFCGTKPLLAKLKTRWSRRQ